VSTKKLLVSAAEIAANPGERKTHFLNPNADRLRLSLGDGVGLKNIGVHRVTSNRDATPPNTTSIIRKRNACTCWKARPRCA